MAGFGEVRTHFSLEVMLHSRYSAASKRAPLSPTIPFCPYDNTRHSIDLDEGMEGDNPEHVVKSSVENGTNVEWPSNLKPLRSINLRH